MPDTETTQPADMMVSTVSGRKRTGEHFTTRIRLTETISLTGMIPA